MKIGLDLDNTISEIPLMFSILSRGLIAEGHEVHVITYRTDREQIARELQDYKVGFTAIHIPEEHPLGGGPIPLWKAAVAKDLGLHVMFEDSPENLSAMPEGIKRVWICDPEFFDLGKCIKNM